jgi:hypothetical protein
MGHVSVYILGNEKVDLITTLCLFGSISQDNKHNPGTCFGIQELVVKICHILYTTFIFII